MFINDKSERSKISLHLVKGSCVRTWAFYCIEKLQFFLSKPSTLFLCIRTTETQYVEVRGKYASDKIAFYASWLQELWG
jgi:hypothetical protein